MLSNALLPRLLLALTIGAITAYWSWLLYVGLEQPIDAMLPDLGGLARYLLGIVVLLGMLWGVAHLSYRLAFRRWMLRNQTVPYYWAWVWVLAWLMFEGLQARTEAVPEFVDENLLVMAVLITFVIGYGYAADYVRTRRDQLKLMQQTTEAELTALRAQVNPHFLFNALNTIYNEAQRAHNDHVADLIGQLAGLMRYTLQESNRPMTTVANELAFIEKYVALQRARLPQSDRLQVALTIDSDEPVGRAQTSSIAPLLLLPFVENAFQYGISLDHPSYITITITAEEGQLHLRVVNSCPPGVGHRHGAGTGITNVRQRLERAYPARHQLHIEQSEDAFSVDLTLNHRFDLCYTPLPSTTNRLHWRS